MEDLGPVSSVKMRYRASVNKRKWRMYTGKNHAEICQETSAKQTRKISQLQDKTNLTPTQNCTENISTNSTYGDCKIAPAYLYLRKGLLVKATTVVCSS